MKKITTVDELREYVESVVMPAAAEHIAQSERDLIPELYVFDGDELTLIALAVDLDNRTKNMIATAMKALVLVGAQAVAFVSETWVIRLSPADEALADSRLRASLSPSRATCSSHRGSASWALG